MRIRHTHDGQPQIPRPRSNRNVQTTGRYGPAKPYGWRGTWSPEIAHAVGLMATDGNLSRDGHHLELTSKDLEQIQNLQRCFGIRNRITKKGSSYSRRLYFRIQFGNVALYQWLTAIGLNPRKSKTLGMLNIPDKYFTDFLRGCFDGDGHTEAYWDRAWPSSFRVYTSFNSASKAFLVWIQNNLRRLLSIEGRIRLATRQYRLQYAKRESLVLLRHMYAVPGSIRRSRKWEKVRSHFTNVALHQTRARGWRRRTMHEEA
jgi:hypothetical protein